MKSRFSHNSINGRILTELLHRVGHHKLIFTNRTTMYFLAVRTGQVSPFGVVGIFSLVRKVFVLGANRYFFA